MKSLFLLSVVLLCDSQEVTTPSNQLSPRNYNHHPYLAKQSQGFKRVEPTKQGPVLFPNDAPPPPRPPLVVTSRPLIESVARSELNNSIASSSQLNHVTYRPDFLGRSYKNDFLDTSYKADFLGTTYKPDFLATTYKPDFLGTTYKSEFLGPTVSPLPYGDFVTAVPYPVKKFGLDTRYNYEVQTPLLSIYKTIPDHTHQKIVEKKPHNDYQIKEPDYSNQYESNHVDDNDSSEYNQGKNYAFSYSVKDHKTGDDFSHSQHSSGSATNGEYRVRLPDGRMQIVSYTADENGYKADVRYDDEKLDEQYNDINQNNRDYNVNNGNNDNLYTVNKKYDTRPDYNDYNIHASYKQDYKHIINKNNDYINNDYRVKETPVKEENTDYADLTKEYYNDYSAEYPRNEPHISKFSSFLDKSDPIKDYTTAKPTYDQLKEIFAKTLFTAAPTPKVDIHNPATVKYDDKFDDEDVVLIGNRNLYTNVNKGISSYNVEPTRFVATTPSSYLASTIENLKNRVNGVSFTKPVLSQNFLNKINKYLTFNKK